MGQITKVSQIKLSNYYIKNIVKLALNEDLYPSGDITSSLVKNKKLIKVKLISNQHAVVAGLEFAKQTFKLIDSKIKQFVKLVNKKSKICCTRKTIPTLRVIQKYAVKLGGGTNHRFNLSDEFLIKDNHIASSDIKTLVSLAIKNKKGRKITVEVDNLKQLKTILGLKFNTVLFDNMSNKAL